MYRILWLLLILGICINVCFAEAPSTSSSWGAGEWTAIFTGILAFVGVVQAIAVGVQAHFTRKAFDAAEQAATANAKNAKVAEEGMKIASRAYLIIEQFTPHDVAGEESFVLGYGINNIGKTAGKVFVHKEAIKYVHSLDELSADPLIDSYPGTQIDASIPPGGLLFSVRLFS